MRMWMSTRITLPRRFPLLTQTRLKETRTLRKDKLVQRVALLFSPISDDNLYVARVREDWELILRLVCCASEMRPVRAMATDGRSARRCDRGCPSMGESALCALGVWI